MMCKRLPITFVAVAAVFAFGCGSSSTDTGAGGSNAAGGPSTGGGAGQGGGAAGVPGSGGSGTGGSGIVDASGAGGAVVDGTAPAGDKCWGRTAVGAGTSGVIDDFEDGDLNISANDGRTGQWTLNVGTGCTVTPSPLLPAAPIAAGGKNTSTKALDIDVTTCTSGASLAASLNMYTDTTATPVGDAGPPWYTCAYDASKYDGVYFWGAGDADAIDITVQLPLRTTIPRSLGGDGSCETGDGGAGCWDDYVNPVRLNKTWALYSFAWGTFIQSGWGTPTPFDAKLVTGINFSIDSKANTLPAAVWLDDIGFYKGSPPAGP